MVVGRVDTQAVRQAYPLTALAATYGVALAGRAPLLMGRCPLHDDHTPSFLVDERDQHYHCFGCGAHGDVIDLVRRVERLDFRRAVQRLTGIWQGSPRVPARPAFRRRSTVVSPGEDMEAQRCLAAAVELYRNQLLAEPAALAYLAGRGLQRQTLERWRVGYSSGDTLLPYLRWRQLSPAAAQRAGLLDRAGRERMTGRVVLPELRAGRPCWLIGRVMPRDSTGPKYRGLPGPKPLLGWDEARGATAVVIVEGVIDRLVLAQWGVPAIALAGTHASAVHLSALRYFQRVYLALDADVAGRAAAATLAGALGQSARLVAIPDGAKDVADLATRPDGRAVLLRALRQAAVPAAA